MLSKVEKKEVLESIKQKAKEWYAESLTHGKYLQSENLYTLKGMVNIATVLMDKKDLHNVINTIILLNKETLLESWNDICQWSISEQNHHRIITHKNIKLIKDTIDMMSINQEQEQARIRVLESFEERLYNMEIQLPEKY